ncbi:hypothetical protein LLG95_04020 [bacterium]|nr:hypothetical protein [bacterium]
MDPLETEFWKAIDGKEKRRKWLASLPIHEKVRILIRMQKMIYPLVKDRDPRACVWHIPGYDDDTPKSPPMG